jgi:hypothetical protein
MRKSGKKYRKDLNKRSNNTENGRSKAPAERPKARQRKDTLTRKSGRLAQSEKRRYAITFEKRGDSEAGFL